VRGIPYVPLALSSLVLAAGIFLDARPRLGARGAAAWALATLLAAGLAAPLYLLIRPSRSPSWGLAEILALTLFFAVAIPLLGSVFGGASGGAPPPPVIAALAVIQNACFAAAAVYVVRVKYHLPLAALGLTVDRWALRLRQAAGAAAAAVAGNSLGQTVTVLVLGAWMGRSAASDLVVRDELRSPVYRVLPSLHQRVEIVALVLLVGVVVPIGEEIFFRGLTYGALRRRFNRPLAALPSALVFAAAHREPTGILPIMLLGIVLAYAYDYTGSLVPGMIAHGVNNLTALASFYQSPPGAL